MAAQRALTVFILFTVPFNNIQTLLNLFFFLAGVNHLSLPLRKHSLTSVTKRPTPSILFVSFFYALLADIVIMIDSSENAIYCKLSFEVKCY